MEPTKLKSDPFICEFITILFITPIISSGLLKPPEITVNGLWVGKKPTPRLFNSSLKNQMYILNKGRNRKRALGKKKNKDGVIVR